MKKIILLGSTGSIGTQTLEVVEQNKDRFSVTALTCGTNIDLMTEQIKRFRPEVCVVWKRKMLGNCRSVSPRQRFCGGRRRADSSGQGFRRLGCQRTCRNQRPGTYYGCHCIGKRCCPCE